jgi:hypothetical protein
MKSLLIISEQEYEVAAKRLEALKKAGAGSKDNKELKLLQKALTQFQRRNHPAPVGGTSQVRY